MSIVTMKRVVIEELAQIREVAEIQDEDGNVVGTFYPGISEFYNQKIPPHILDKIDDAEIERRCKSKERGRTLEEIKQRWKEIEAQEKAS
jgi:hypothetical protein